MSNRAGEPEAIFVGRPEAVELRRRTAGWGQVRVWLPPVIAMAAIAVESTDTFSAAHTGSWLRPIVERVTGHLSDATWAGVHHGFRKTGHFCGYGMVCLTFLRAWLLTLGRSAVLTRAAWRVQSSALAVGSTAVVASLDEWHQTFIPSRTGAISDVGLDTAGAALTCVLVWMVYWQMSASRLRRSSR